MVTITTIQCYSPANATSYQFNGKTLTIKYSDTPDQTVDTTNIYDIDLFIATFCPNAKQTFANVEIGQVWKCYDVHKSYLTQELTITSINGMWFTAVEQPSRYHTSMLHDLYKQEISSLSVDHGDNLSDNAFDEYQKTQSWGEYEYDHLNDTVIYLKNI